MGASGAALLVFLRPEGTGKLAVGRGGRGGCGQASGLDERRGKRRRGKERGGK